MIYVGLISKIPLMSASADYQVLNLNVVLTSSRLNTACACTARLVHGGESETKTGITLTNKDEDPRAKLSPRDTQPLRQHSRKHSCMREFRSHPRRLGQARHPHPTRGSSRHRQGIPTTLPLRAYVRVIISCFPTVPHVPRANHAAVTTLLLRACRQSPPPAPPPLWYSALFARCPI